MSMAFAANARDAHIRVFDWRNIRRIDFALMACVFLLAGIGLLVLYSASRSATSATLPYYHKQAIFFSVGCVLALLISCFDHRFLISFAPLFYSVFVALLIAVLLVGAEVKGGQRWIDIGPVRFQPSEYSKLAVIFMLAWYLGKIGRSIERLPYFLLTFAIVAVPGFLIFKEPDLGTALTLGPITFAMLYAAGCRRAHLVGLVILGLAAIPVLWSQLANYQKQRVLTIMNPGSDAQGSGYHTIQSMITVGSGGVGGKGYMKGTQTYLSYLPEHHTDFIFSVLAEEFGFIGGVTVLGLFLLLFIRGLFVARNCKDMAGSLLAVGIVALIAFHVFVNIAITIGIMPVTGLPLPFFSYGGSFYLATMTAIGVLLSVNAHRGMFQRSGRLAISNLYR